MASTASHSIILPSLTKLKLTQQETKRFARLVMTKKVSRLVTNT
jgi:hypothetical protein